VGEGVTAETAERVVRAERVVMIGAREVLALAVRVEMFRRVLTRETSPRLRTLLVTLSNMEMTYQWRQANESSVAS
jgi:tRNA A37 methylthiotransferase MiaB